MGLLLYYFRTYRLIINGLRPTRCHVKLCNAISPAIPHISPWQLICIEGFSVSGPLIKESALKLPWPLFVSNDGTSRGLDGPSRAEALGFLGGGQRSRREKRAAWSAAMEDEMQALGIQGNQIYSGSTASGRD
ncbi:hypothetical protein BDV39DRAFT_208460 [Aspergillus sergii]|uniref:Uncharacterized protein n=1 Tax=Aspergillus sergii TaxID=1034303 RepID=A0A5N6WSD7_9EURO|nr:hypothetical protein BDV39DRAFT_208460 [Aspergillus sergii]